MIEWHLGEAYALPWTTDEYVFARILLKQAGIKVEEGQLNHEAMRVIVDLALELDCETPRPLGGGIRTRSGTEIVEAAITTVLAHLTPEDAKRAVRGLRPLASEANARRFQLAPRAGIVPILQRVGNGVVQDFHRRRQFHNADTDSPAESVQT